LHRDSDDFLETSNYLLNNLENKKTINENFVTTTIKNGKLLKKKSTSVNNLFIKKNSINNNNNNVNSINNQNNNKKDVNSNNSNNYNKLYHRFGGSVQNLFKVKSFADTKKLSSSDINLSLTNLEENHKQNLNKMNLINCPCSKKQIQQQQQKNELNSTIEITATTFITEKPASSTSLQNLNNNSNSKNWRKYFNVNIMRKKKTIKVENREEK